MAYLTRRKTKSMQFPSKWQKQVCKSVCVSRGQHNGMSRFKTRQEHFSHTLGSQDFPDRPRIVLTLSLAFTGTNTQALTPVFAFENERVCDSLAHLKWVKRQK